MNSYILYSDACRHCQLTPDSDADRRILRTPNSDICTTCGALIQTFPTMSMTCDDPTRPGHLGTLPIPTPVQVILEQLLRQRLFQVARGYNPRKANNGNGTRHRTGDQALIELEGPGNCTAAIRWSYSDSDGYAHAQRELARGPKAQVEKSLPTRIRRALDVVSDHLNITETGPGHRAHRHHYIRLENSFPLERQPVDLANLCLVVKVELSWLRVGLSSPNETGPREFYVSQEWHTPFLTLEEALDRILHEALDSNGRSVYATVWHAPRRGHPVGRYEHDPIRSYDARNTALAYTRPEIVLVGTRVATAGYYGVISSGDRGLLPSDMLGFTVRVFSKARVTATIDGIAVLDREFEKGDHFFEAAEALAGKNGKLTTTIARGDEVVTAEYYLVTAEEYADAHDRFVEDFKRSEVIRLREHVPFRRQMEPIPAMQAGEKIAARLGAVWLEGTYVGPAVEGGSHLVHIDGPGARCQWSVVDVKPLQRALRDGLEVVPPYDAGNPCSLSRLERVVAIE